MNKTIRNCEFQSEVVVCYRDGLFSSTRFYKQVYQTQLRSLHSVVLRISFNYSSGHTWGWCSAQYLRAVNLADNQVGVLLDAIDNVNASDEVMVVLR